MGADLIVAATKIRTGRQPDWDAAERFISTLTLEQVDEDYSGAFTGMENDEEMRIYIRGSLADFKEIVAGDCPRDLTWFDVLGHRIYLAGGTSWGDSPGDTFDLICDLSAAGVLMAAGFDRPVPYDDIESIARQVLGHAYPDRSFDELSAEEIETVADHLCWADETLSTIMPIVAEKGEL